MYRRAASIVCLASIIFMDYVQTSRGFKGDGHWGRPTMKHWEQWRSRSPQPWWPCNERNELIASSLIAFVITVPINKEIMAKLSGRFIPLAHDDNSRGVKGKHWGTSVKLLLQVLVGRECSSLPESE